MRTVGPDVISRCPVMPRLVWSMACGSSRFGQCVGDLVRGRRRRLASGVHDEVSCRDHPRARLPVLGEVSQAPGLCFRGALDALAQYVLIGIENDVEHREPGVAQASEYVLQVSTSKDRLRAMRCWPVKRANSVLVATTSRRHGGQCWKSETGWSARLGRSMYPTVSGSNRRLDGISERNSAAVVVFPQPKAPFSHTITWSCYERPRFHAAPGRGFVTWRRREAVAVSGHDELHRPGPVSSDRLVAVADPLRLAVAAYLARFKGSSREHTESDLRCFLTWCAERGLEPLAARRPHLELYIRSMQEIRQFKPSTVSRRFSVAAGFYRTCVIDGVMEHSPAEHVRRPAVPAESPTLGLTHLQFEAMQRPPGNPPIPATSPSWPCSGSWNCGSSRLLVRTSPTWVKSMVTGCCACAAKVARSSWFPCRQRSAGPSTGRQAHVPGGRSCSTAAVPGWTVTPPPAACGDSPKPQGCGSGERIRTCSGTPSSRPCSTPGSICATS
jgi:hypothetical protein